MILDFHVRVPVQHRTRLRERHLWDLARLDMYFPPSIQCAGDDGCF